MAPKYDMDEPVNIETDPDTAMKILLGALNDPELPPVGSPPPTDD